MVGDEVIFVPRNKNGGYNISLKVIRDLKKGHKVIPSSSQGLEYYVTADFVELMGLQPDRRWPLWLGKIDIHECGGGQNIYYQFRKSGIPLKYEEVIRIITEVGGFKRQL